MLYAIGALILAAVLGFGAAKLEHANAARYKSERDNALQANGELAKDFQLRCESIQKSLDDQAKKDAARIAAANKALKKLQAQQANDAKHRQELEAKINAAPTGDAAKACAAAQSASDAYARKWQ